MARKWNDAARCLGRHRLLLAAILLLGVLAWPGATPRARAQGGDGPLALADFHAAIHQLAGEIESAGDLTARQQSIRQARAHFQSFSGVILANGDVVHPDFGFLDAADPEQTLARLHLLDAQLTLAAADDVSVRLAQLDETLQALGMSKIAQIQPQKIAPQPTPTPARAATGADSILFGLLKWALIAGGGALLVYVLGSWLSGVLGDFVEDASLRSQEEGAAPVTSRQARQMATSMARSGDYRAAVRQLYLSALLKLEETGAVPRDRSKTNRELLASLRRDAPVRQHLQPVVDTFDRVWYGVREPDASTFSSYAAEIDRLQQALARHRPAAKAGVGDKVED